MLFYYTKQQLYINIWVNNITIYYPDKVVVEKFKTKLKIIYKTKELSIVRLRWWRRGLRLAGDTFLFRLSLF